MVFEQWKESNYSFHVWKLSYSIWYVIISNYQWDRVHSLRYDQRFIIIEKRKSFIHITDLYKYYVVYKAKYKTIFFTKIHLYKNFAIW